MALRPVNAEPWRARSWWTAAELAEADRIADETITAPAVELPSPFYGGPGRDAGPSRENEPSRENPVGGLLHREPSTGFKPTRSTPPTRSPLAPDDLRGERLRALDNDPAVKAAFARLGVNDAQAWAAKVSGRQRRLSGPELAVWKLDLLRAAGLIEPVPVDLPDLPEGASEAARTLRRRFAVLLGLRRLRGDGDDPAPFTKRFAADWCGLSESTALRALGELLRAGVIVKAGEHPSRHGRSPAALYLPGTIER